MNNITVKDLETMVKIIDLACANGSYKDWETIQTVFDLRSRLDNFLKNVSVQQAAEPPAEAS